MSRTGAKVVSVIAVNAVHRLVGPSQISQQKRLCYEQVIKY